MITAEKFSKMALAFPEVTEVPHFVKTSFRIREKIFATLSVEKNEAVIKLAEIDQDIFSRMSNGSINPVDNKWGLQGWTFVNLGTVNDGLLNDALISAYCEVAPMQLSNRFRSQK